MGHTPQSRFGSSRRTVMRTIGVGAGASVLGGTASARAGDRDAVAQTDDGSDGDDGGDGATVHEVRTLISGPPTNEGRPADFFYQPTGLHVEPGDVIRYVFATPDHNVVGYHPAFGMRRRMPTGVSAFSSPLLGWKPGSIPGDMVDPPTPAGGEGGDDGGGTPVPDSWLASFDTPGVYDVLCSPHEHFGMAMRVVVGDVTEAPFETSDPQALPEPRVGPAGLARVTLTDPALRPSAIVEAGRVEWGALSANRGGGGGDGEDGGGTPTGTPTGTPEGTPTGTPTGTPAEE